MATDTSVNSAHSDAPSAAPSYGGLKAVYINRNTTFMSWNLMHLASILKNAGGIPAYGNSCKDWNAGERFGFDANPEYR